MKKLAAVGFLLVTLAVTGCMCMLPESRHDHGKNGTDHAAEESGR